MILTPPSRAFTRRDWRGLEHLPATGGVLVAANHISSADPIALTDFLVHGARRAPRFLAKHTLFAGDGLVGRVMRGAGQIPVDRGAEDPSAALDAAVQALQDGRCVVIYPEGTVTRDPDRWPMPARTGVARLALLSGAPVVPVGQWGAHRVHGGGRRVRLLPRSTVSFLAGPPVDLSPWQGRPLTAEVLRQATEAIMAAITAQVEVLRGETAPVTTDRRPA